MNAYLLTTAVIFALITGAHIARMVVESSVLAEPFYLFLTAVAAALSVWAWYLLWVRTRSPIARDSEKSS